jgi:hypothetical protein
MSVDFTPHVFIHDESNPNSTSYIEVDARTAKSAYAPPFQILQNMACLLERVYGLEQGVTIVLNAYNPEDPENAEIDFEVIPMPPSALEGKTPRATDAQALPLEMFFHDLQAFMWQFPEEPGHIIEHNKRLQSYTMNFDRIDELVYALAMVSAYRGVPNDIYKFPRIGQRGEDIFNSLASAQAKGVLKDGPNPEFWPCAAAEDEDKIIPFSYFSILEAMPDHHVITPPPGLLNPWPRNKRSPMLS